MYTECEHRCYEWCKRSTDIRHHRPSIIQKEYLHKRRRRSNEFPDPVNDEIKSFDRRRFQYQPYKAGHQGKSETRDCQTQSYIDSRNNYRECIGKCFPTPIAHQLATPFLAIFSPFLDSQMRGSAMMKYIISTIR